VSATLTSTRFEYTSAAKRGIRVMFDAHSYLRVEFWSTNDKGEDRHVATLRVRDGYRLNFDGVFTGWVGNAATVPWSEPGGDVVFESEFIFLPPAVNGRPSVRPRG